MGLYKRGPVWWMRFTYQGKQVRRSTETADKKLAQKIYNKVMGQVAEGKWFDVTEGKEKTFEELARKYEFQEFKQLKSWKSSYGAFKQLREYFGSYPLTEITPALIDDFKRMRKSQGVTPATINRQLSRLKRMFNLAKKRWLWIKEVPIIEMEPNADNKRIRHLSFEEYHLLLDFCDEWLKAIVTFAAWTGLGQGNILGLKRSQINLSAGTITIDWDLMKNKENLLIPISSPALKALKTAMKVTHIKSPYAFSKVDGSPYSGREVRRSFRKAILQAEIKDFRFHDLRHCFATWNRQAGVDIDTLADLMGHKDTRMTRRYAHITPVHLRSSIDLLEKRYSEFSTNLAHSDKKDASHLG